MEGTNLSRIVGRCGRWSEDTATFLFAVAGAKAQACPFVLQNRVKGAYICRWSAVLACSAARAFTASLRWGGDAPLVHEVVRDDSFGWWREGRTSLLTLSSSFRLKKIIATMWKILMKFVDDSWASCIWDALNGKANGTKLLFKSTDNVRIANLRCTNTP